MNPVTNALRRVREDIPVEILEKTFIDLKQCTVASMQGIKSVVSLDQLIREKIVDARVRVDCNLVGGQEHTIPLQGIVPTSIDVFNLIYTIPKDKTMGKSITSVTSVSFGGSVVLGGFNQPMMQQSTGQQTINSVMSSSLPPPTVSTANCQLIDENVVLITDVIAVPRNLYLRCWIENDYNFNNIKPTSYENFADLVILATKAYIYNKSIVTMDKAYIYAGGELGRYAEVVNSYSEANVEYKEKLIVWRRVSLMNDNNACRRMVRRLVGGGWY